VWLLASGAALLWAVLTLVRGLFARSMPTLLAFLDPGMSSGWTIWPWAQFTMALVALFFLFGGLGLMRRSRWTQTLLVPAHLLFAVYALALWVGEFLVRGHLYEGWLEPSLALLATIVINVALALWMNSVSTSEALSWLPLRTAPLVPLKCEFCGTPLDPANGRCPQCEAEPQIAQNVPLKPPDAMLVGTADEREFYITPAQATTIGRGSARNQINLSNPTVSRRHAQIAFDNGRYVLKALDDRNGTFVNNTRVRQQTLHDGDEIRFGRASYIFEIMEQAYRA
jgi:hypothetical protein